MQESWSYIKAKILYREPYISLIKDSRDFVNIMNQIGDIPENVIFVNVDILGLYHSIPHKAELKLLNNALEK